MCHIFSQTITAGSRFRAFDSSLPPFGPLGGPHFGSKKVPRSNKSMVYIIHAREKAITSKDGFQCFLH